jgi:integrase
MANKGLKFPPEIYTREELTALLHAFPRTDTGIRNAALAATYIYSAVRCSEATDLRPCDIDLTECSLTVMRGKGSYRRCVGIHPNAIPYIQDWVEIRPDSQYLFCTMAGGRLDSSFIRKMIKRYASKAGIRRRAHVHGLRHSSIVHAVEAGLPVRLAQKQLGHASLQQTAHYLDHLKPRAVIEGMRALSL